MVDTIKDRISDEEANNILNQSQNAIEEYTSQYNEKELKRSFDRAKGIPADDLAAVIHEPVPYTPPVRKVLKMDDARLPFWKVYTSVIKREPTVTVQNAKNLKKVLHWLLNWKNEQAAIDGQLDPTKGLYIYGGFGRGKTDLINTLRIFCSKALQHYDNIPKLPAFMSYKGMLQKARAGHNTAWQYEKKEIAIIDDLGFNDEAQIKLFGNTIDLVGEIIYNRHGMYKRDHNWKTIMTSNLSPEAIQDINGDGVMGRLIEMCNIIHWDGPDFRTLI